MFHLRYPLTLIVYPYILPSIPSHLYLFYWSVTDILFSAYPFHYHTWHYITLLIRGGCKPILRFIVEFSCAFWILGSTSYMMIRLDRLLIYLQLCFHFDSWYVVFRLACFWTQSFGKLCFYPSFDFVLST